MAIGERSAKWPQYGEWKMALGLTYSSGGGDFLPIIKYDARAGRIFRVDRADGVSTPVDVTRNFKAVIDLENIEVGYINFNTGGAPDFQMVPLGSAMPEKRSPAHKQGIRVLVKLGAESGGDVREVSSCAAAFLRGFDALHTAYEAQAAENPEKLPVVVLRDTVPITSGSGDKKSTNYEPVFEIAAWAPRPKDLVASPRGGSTPVGASAAPRQTPPATGATKVAPPAAAPPTARTPEPAGAEDFG
jgi:hypothetical protein